MARKHRRRRYSARPQKTANARVAAPHSLVQANSFTTGGHYQGARKRPLFNARYRAKQYAPLIHTVLGDTNHLKPNPKHRYKIPTLTTQLNAHQSLSKRTRTCLARSQRKEVLFAKKLTSKGSTGKKHITLKSHYRCK